MSEDARLAAAVKWGMVKSRIAKALFGKVRNSKGKVAYRLAVEWQSDVKSSKGEAR